MAFDADAAGEKAAAWWLAALPQALRWRPLAHDVNERPEPAAVREWVLAGLAAAGQGDACAPAGCGAVNDGAVNDGMDEEGS